MIDLKNAQRFVDEHDETDADITINVVDGRVTSVNVSYERRIKRKEIEALHLRIAALEAGSNE